MPTPNQPSLARGNNRKGEEVRKKGKLTNQAANSRACLRIDPELTGREDLRAPATEQAQVATFHSLNFYSILTIILSIRNCSSILKLNKQRLEEVLCLFQVSKVMSWEPRFELRSG